MQKISVEEALKLKDKVVIDTRSPVEFEKDRVPGAVNIPILENEERKVVGTLYKDNPDEAIKLGYEYYNKKLPHMVEAFKKLDKDKKIIIYCWRGGMRSQTITKLVSDLGFNAFLLDGGYRSYRRYIRAQLEKYEPPFTFIVLYGLAGSGKTELIKQLTPSIDLEGLAQHRSSNFGAIGLEPREQKLFESLLFKRLKELEGEKAVFIEGESHKVGRVFIPNSIFKAMKRGIAVRVDCSIENRAKQIVKDYFTHGEDDKIRKIIVYLKPHLTKKVVENLLKLMDEKNYEEVSKILLQDYYDSKYEHQISQANCSYTVCNDDMQECIKELKKIAGQSEN
ncbi:tRNA 2-selenouridine(34) synthase MnmH [Candidatus Woesearchaeota archaeon]|nr:tRNA 2-selenouridine(34) synthase MnmH [Candidatus Woesearchaeota archaeon]